MSREQLLQRAEEIASAAEVLRIAFDRNETLPLLIKVERLVMR
jgi:hypothetical protein